MRELAMALARRGSAAGLLGLLLAMGSAAADDDCGVVAANGTAICNAANETPAGAYADGIVYSVTGLTLNHAGGTGGTAFINSGGEFVGFGALVVNNLAGATITETSGGTLGGIFASSFDGTVTISNAGSIVTNSDSISGVALLNGVGGSSVDNSGTITTRGLSANGITATLSGGEGLLTINHSGTIVVEGRGDGINTTNPVGDTDINVTGDITANGSGVFATYAGGAGLTGGGVSQFGGGPLISVSLDNATIDVEGDGDDAGINLFSSPSDLEVTVGSTGVIEVNGANTPGIFMFGASLLDVTMNGRIVSEATGGKGILMTSSFGDMYLSMAGSISTVNNLASGVFMDVRNGDRLGATLASSARIETAGETAHGLHLRGGARAFFDIAGQVLTSGDGSDAIHSEVEGCSTIEVGGTARARGAMSAGIYITIFNFQGGGFAPDEKPSVALVPDPLPTPACADGHTADVTIVGDVQGGYDTGGAGSRAAGVSIVDPQLAVLSQPLLVDIDNRGDLGALTDVAVLADIGVAGIGIDVVNSGDMIGELRFFSAGVNNSVINSGLWGIRGFADTDGDGLRDQERVATSYFDGDSDQVDNLANGTIALLSSAGTDIGAAGIEEGRIVGLELLRNAGLITMADAATGAGSAIAGDRLLIEGNLEGLNGRLALDSLLNAGGAGNQTTDRLLIQGDVTGTTRVFVSNAGGLGALTGTAANEGISIIQVSGQAAADSFVLGAQVVGGAYLYTLNAFDPAASDDSEIDTRLDAPDFWDFRLQSTGQIFLGTREYPLIVTAASQAFWTDLDVLHRRMGELRVAIGDPFRYQVQPAQSAGLGVSDLQEAVRPGAGPGGPEGAWFKGYGSEFDITAGSGFTQSTYGGIAGYDIGFEDTLASGDMLLLGPTLGIAGSRVDFGESSSTLQLDIYRVGAYAVYFDGPLYLDGVAKLDVIDAVFAAPSSASEAEFAMATAGASLEVGYTWMLDERNFLEPQAQVAYSHTWAEDFEDGSGAEIDLDDSDSLIGRLGLRAGTVLQTGQRGRIAPYLQAGVLHEFLGGTAATVSDLTFDAGVAGTSYEVGIGAHGADLASNVSAYVDLLYRFGGEVEGVKGLVGIRYSW